MTLEQIDLRLREVPLNYTVRNADLLADELARHKRNFLAQHDQLGAKEVWCLERTLKAQEIYIEAFTNLKQKQYYAAWCALEDVELVLRFLRRHFGMRQNDYWLDFILGKTHQLQKLFPYKLFFSPEFVYKSRKCGTCGSIVSLRRPCGHRVGEIYDGEMCHHLIEKVEMPSVSFVTNPHQKYSVVFRVDPETEERVDDYDYSLVKRTIAHLDTPFQDWWIRETKRRFPHHAFPEKPRDNCPCGSGETFQNCCLAKPFVMLDHILFMVDERVPGERNRTQYFRGAPVEKISRSLFGEIERQLVESEQEILCSKRKPR